MGEKICSHCGTTILVGLQYCPGCLCAAPVQSNDAADEKAKTAVGATSQTARVESLQPKSLDFAPWLNPGSAPNPAAKVGPRTTSKTPSGFATMSLSDGYTRVVCPKCLRPQRAPLDQSPSAMVVCGGCFHQFPGALAAEFRKGADLACFQCGVTSFCLDGSKVTQCPNCKIQLRKAYDPEKAKFFAFCGAVGLAILTGFGHSVATNTTPQFLLWLCIASVFTFFGFITMVALGF